MLFFSRPHCGAKKKLRVEKKACRGRKQDGPIARSRKKHLGVEKKSSPKSSARCSQIASMILCGIQSNSLNCSQKEQWFELAACMYALVLAPCSNCGGSLCKGTFSTGFSGLVNESAKPSKTVGHSIETILTGVAFCSYGHCQNHVGTLNGAISGILGAGHGMAERDAAGCPSKSRRLPPCMGTEWPPR